MSIRFQCQCGNRYTVSDEHGGKLVTCKQCNRKLRVPTAAPPRPVQKVEEQAPQFFSEDPYEVDYEPEVPEPPVPQAPRATSKPRKKRSANFLARLPGGPAIWLGIPAAIAVLFSVLAFFSTILAGLAMFLFLIAGLGLWVGGMIWSLVVAFRQGIGTFVGFLIGWIILTLHLIAGGMGRPPLGPSASVPIGVGGVMAAHMIRRRDEFGRPALCCLASLPPFLLGAGAAYLAQRHETAFQTKVQDFVLRAEAAKYRNTEKQVYFDAPFMWEQVQSETSRGEIVRYKRPNSDMMYMLVRVADVGASVKDIDGVQRAARDAQSKRDAAASVKKSEIVTIGNRKAVRIEVALPGTNQELLAYHFLRDAEVVIVEYFAPAGGLDANLESFEQSAKTIGLDAGALTLVPTKNERVA